MLPWFQWSSGQWSAHPWYQISPKNIVIVKLTVTFNLYATFNPKHNIQSRIESFEMALEHLKKWFQWSLGQWFAHPLYQISPKNIHQQEYQYIVIVKLNETFDLYATFNPKLTIQSTIESFEMEFEHMNKCKRKTNENWNITNNIKKFAIVYDCLRPKSLTQISLLSRSLNLKIFW